MKQKFLNNLPFNLTAHRQQSKQKI